MGYPYTKDYRASKPSLLERCKNLVYDTPIEIAIGAVLFGASVYTFVYADMKSKENEIPTAFSEIEKITREFQDKGEFVPPLTATYAKAHDTSTKVFESSNIALSEDSSHETFARELRTRVQEEYAEYATISKYAEELPVHARDALGRLQELISARAELGRVSSLLESAWREDHDDHYDTVTSTDSEGNTTSTEVYSHSTHDYWYSASQGRQAAALFDGIVDKYPSLRIDDILHVSREVGNDNKNAMYKSMERKFKKAEPTEADLLRLSRKWASGSNYTKYKSSISSRYNGAVSLEDDWSGASRTAKSHYHYRTYSSSHSGPRQYQVSENLKGHIYAVEKATDRIVNGIRFAGNKAPELDRKIKQYVDTVLGLNAEIDVTRGDPDELRKEIMGLAREIYDKNFEDGFDVHTFKWSKLLLLTALGTALGGVAGFGADRGISAARGRSHGRHTFGRMGRHHF